MPASRITPDNPPVPPVQPELEDCCNSGCNPCIFDLYQEALERYREDLRAWEERNKAAATRRKPTAKKRVATR
jgi:hypothetical protein